MDGLNRVMLEGFHGYAVDNTGNVYSSKYGTERALKPWPCGASGHLAVALMRDRKRKNMLVHRLVATAFIGLPPEGKPNVLHRDGNPRNNALGNLYYGDQADNAADMVRHGRCFPLEHPGKMLRGDAHPSRRNPSCIIRGEAIGGSKLVANDVREIRGALARGQVASDVARRFGVTVQNVCLIRDGRTWRHVA